MGRWELFRADAKSLLVIGVSAVVGVGLTAALLRQDSRQVRVEARASAPAVERIEVTAAAGSAAGDRLYGTATTTAGESLKGFVRWDLNEASWSDLLEGEKPGSRNVTAAVRFGHVARISPAGSRSADITLRGGEVVRLNAVATDIGAAVRGIRVEAGGETAQLDWRDLRHLDFQPAPEDAPEAARRLYGTVTTTTGLELSGHVTWDVKDVLTSDVLEGRDDRGRSHRIAFGNVRSIVNDGEGGARVTLTDGERIRLRSGSGVGSSVSGISISDPNLGQVMVESWRDFASVTFEEAGEVAGFDAFDGPAGIAGEVVTKAGSVHSGVILWDADEAGAWEVLDGKAGRATFKIEFSKLARVAPDGRGALVELKDGRSFILTGSNDVDSSHQGLIVSDGGRMHRVDWSDVREVRFRAP